MDRVKVVAGVVLIIEDARVKPSAGMRPVT